MKNRLFSLLSLFLLCALLCSACGVPLNLEGIDPDTLFHTTTTTEQTEEPTTPAESSSSEQTDNTEPSSEVTEPSETGTSTSTDAMTNATEPSTEATTTTTTTTEDTIDDLPELTPPTTNQTSFTVSAEGVITAYLGSDTVVEIPAQIESHTVTGIADGVFQNKTNLIKVVLPATVTSIGANAFSGCTALREIALPVGLMTIGAGAFQNCTSLPIAYLADGVLSVGADAFAGCTNLVLVLGKATDYSTEYKAADVPTYLGISADNYVAQANGLHYAIIDDAVTILRFGYTNTPLMYIPTTLSGKTVTTIGERAFYNAKALTQVSIPSGVRTLGKQAFSGCTMLETMFFNAETILMNDLATYPQGQELFATRVMENIGTESANGVTVKFGDSVTDIPNYLFQTISGQMQTNISALYFGKNITSVPTLAFYGTNPTYLYFNATSVPDAADTSTAAFNNLTTEKGAMSIVIGKDVAKVPNFLFYGCWAAGSVTFESGSVCQTIGESAFSGCGGLTDLTLPDNLHIILQNAFYQAPLDSLVVPNGVTSIGAGAFRQPRSGSAMTYAVLPDTLETLADTAFFNLDSTIFQGIFFYGDAGQWSTLITGAADTSPLKPGGSYEVPVYFFSETATTDGWYMADGVPTPWETI